MAAESLSPILELFPGPALLVRPGGEVVEANDRMERWIGLTRDELRGRPLAELFADPPERVAGLLADGSRDGVKVAGVLSPARGEGAGGECRVEAVSVPADAGPAPLLIHFIPGGHGEADESLREEVRRRDELLNRFAHDLRNSAAAIRGALDLARTATSREDAAWAEDTMDRQVRHLLRQVDDMLDLARITRGRIRLERRRLHAAAAVRAAAATARPLIDEREHQLTIATSAGTPAIDADPARLEQLLVGLLGHAAAATPPGGSIRIAVAREPDAVVFRVRGEGREAAGPARKPAATGDRPAGGPGIGLILVGKLAELHGGSVQLGGEGAAPASEFVVRLPAAADPPGPRPEPTAAARPDPPAGARVLVVDDNVDTARGTARLLQIAGHEVRVAHDGREALEVARAMDPEFVLLDIGLPVMDGYEVARQLRGDPRLRDVVIVAVSGYNQDDYRHSDAVRFDHHMVKPIDYDALRAILSRSA